MATSCVIGLLWGDEGKGKIIDLLAQDADYVVRCAGGHNAGHTIISPAGKLVLHLVPSGAFRDHVVNVIGSGVVVDPWHLEQEVARLREVGAPVELGRSLLVSERAQVILPVHRAMDQVAEHMRGGGRIGTTGRGIGPAYADRASRSGIRMGDLLRPAHLADAVARSFAEKAPLLAAHDVEVPDAAAVAEELAGLGERLAAGIADTGDLLRAAERDGRRILLEGAQGVLLDVDHGTYPYCTSSSSSTAGCAVGTGLPPAALSSVTGVVKAYATRVGEGPFPSELFDSEGDALRDAGNEYGSTTGRPRRCGWFDAVAVRYSVDVSGTREVFLTNLDVLRGFRPLRVASAYELPDGTRIERFPAFELDQLRPVYEEFDGFDEDVTGARTWQDLPAAARGFVEAIEARIGAAIPMVSVGPGRDEVVRR
ncbi:MAG: adenylosuccinate synthase [Planctomycetota bacterium]